MSKSWDMNLHWLRDKENQKEFLLTWEKGSKNLADYFTKHHPTVHLRKMRKQHIRDVVLDTHAKFNMIINNMMI